MHACRKLAGTDWAIICTAAKENTANEQIHAGDPCASFGTVRRPWIQSDVGTRESPYCRRCRTDPLAGLNDGHNSAPSFAISGQVSALSTYQPNLSGCLQHVGRWHTLRCTNTHWGSDRAQSSSFVLVFSRMRQVPFRFHFCALAWTTRPQRVNNSTFVN